MGKGEREETGDKIAGARTYSLSEARRIALAAQGFDRRRPARVTLRDLRRVIHQLGLLQIDYVNVLGPAHYHVPFSRLGPYPRALLDELIYRRREFTEQWAHEASIVPMSSWPLLRYRREEHRPRPYGFEKFLQEHSDFVDSVLEQVRARGPLTAGAFPHPDLETDVLDHAWFKSVPRATLEAHFGRGLLAVAQRLPNFAREYDVAERVIPEPHFSRQVTREEAQRALLLLAAGANGISTAADLADYYRMPAGQARPRVAELVKSGELLEVSVETWSAPAYTLPVTRVPRQIRAAALLSPFDPVVWFRPRAARLFHFDYRVEIFFPETQRKWGYYVLPFLFGERLVARVDLKADRAGARLVVLATHVEQGVDLAEIAAPLARELWQLARWHGLKEVTLTGRNPLRRLLATELSRQSSES